MKYRALRVMAVVMKILAWVVLATGLMLSLATLFATGLLTQSLGTTVPVSARLFMFIGMVAGTLVEFVFLLGSGEAISLLFDIEASTVARPAAHHEEVMKAA